MRISKSMLFKICLIVGLILSAQFSFAIDEVPIPKDGTPGSGDVKPLSLISISASATISDTELAVYFNNSVGDATITVYNASNNVVFQETVDTDSSISISNWTSGNYIITVTYGSTTQRGYFSI